LSALRRPALVLPAAAALGAAQTLAFVHPSWAWPLPIATLAWLVARLAAATPARAALLGLAYGTGWLTAGVWWLFISMHRYGGLPAPLAALAVLALSLVLSLYLALACAAWARWRGGRAVPDAALFAALWLLAELARGVLFTGFPWVASGYAMVDAPLAALAPWLGVYGIGAAVALLAALLGQGAWRATGVAVVGVAALALAGPGEHTQPSGRLTLALVQTDVAQDEKFVAERLPEALASLARALVEVRAQLVVAPETAIPLLPFQLAEVAPGYAEQLRAHFAQPGRAVLVGMPLGDFDRGYTNAVVGWSAAPEYVYRKHHLVPFGEFVPRGFRWFTELMNIPLGDFDRGAVDQPSFAFAGQRIAPNICYEDLFGDELARRFADAATAPTMMANLSNIAWFGRTIAIEQHLNISRLRALEFQRPMIRATNTGATAVIDHRGRVTAMLEPHTRGVLQGEAEGRRGLTPYARWAAHTGLVPPAALALAVAAAAVWRRKQK
jgi:apolipoprotein N-acyltransferase